MVKDSRRQDKESKRRNQCLENDAICLFFFSVLFYASASGVENTPPLPEHEKS